MRSAGASLSALVPIGSSTWNTRIEPGPGISLPGEKQNAPWVNVVSPGWFTTFGMHVIRGRDVSAHTVSGEVHLGRIRAANVSGHSVSGEITAEIETLTGRGDLSFHTVSGDVTLELPKALDAPKSEQPKAPDAPKPGGPQP